MRGRRPPGAHALSPDQPGLEGHDALRGQPGPLAHHGDRSRRDQMTRWTRPIAAMLAEGVTPDLTLQQLVDRYGDSGRGWSRADTAYSVPLPGHRDAWLFSDTFLGQVHPDHPRPAEAPTPPGPPTNPANVNPVWPGRRDG